VKYQLKNAIKRNNIKWRLEHVQPPLVPPITQCNEHKTVKKVHLQSIQILLKDESWIIFTLKP